VDIDVTFTDVNGDIDIYLLDASGALVAGSATWDDNENINVAIPAHGTY